jgi:hypothetical protein
MRLQLERLQEEMEKNRISHREALEKLKATGTCSLLLENYKKIRDQNCDLTLVLFGEKALSVHKAVLIGIYIYY